MLYCFFLCFNCQIRNIIDRLTHFVNFMSQKKMWRFIKKNLQKKRKSTEDKKEVFFQFNKILNW